MTTAASAHRARVAALAGELAIAVGLDEASGHSLRTAIRYRDCSPQLFERAGLSRLATEVAGESAGSSAPVQPEVLAILRGATDPSRTTEAVAPRVELLRLAEALDQELEFTPYQGESSDAEPSPYVAAGLAKLRGGSPSELARVVPRLPVFPAAALAAISKLTGPDVDLDLVEAVAGSDPVLAGALVSAANSALYAPRVEIRSLTRAAWHLGCDTAKSILLAAVFRPLFQSATLRSHWVHALEAADAAQKLAKITGALPPGEATLAALVHDIGLLAISMAKPAVLQRCERLIQSGYPRCGAEWLVCGFDHAAGSGVVLETWKFPPAVVVGVRHHHTPEQCDSALAALLYLAEFWTCTEEDIPSTARLNTAARRLGITVDSVIRLKPEQQLASVLAG